LIRNNEGAAPREKRKGPPLGDPFLILTPYIQNTALGIQTCQICLEILVWKCFVLLGCYFGFEARDLTNFPHVGVLGVRMRFAFAVADLEVRLYGPAKARPFQSNEFFRKL
jgi:hypothetical protein